VPAEDALPGGESCNEPYKISYLIAEHRISVQNIQFGVNSEDLANDNKGVLSIEFIGI